MRNRLMCLWVSVCVALGSAAALRAGSSGSTNLYMPQGGATTTANGDYVTNGGITNPYYRYFVEVPAGLARLRLQIFDADIGAGAAEDTGGTAGRDRSRAGGFTSTVAYSVIDPSGATRLAQFSTGSNTLPAGADNAWLSIYDGNGNDVRDNFGTAAYGNNDGNNNWSANWIEVNDDASAAAGDIRITGGELRVGNTGGAAPSVAREADLLGTPGLNLQTAWLSFDCRTSGNLDAGGDTWVVEVSNNGGGAYTVLETFDAACGARDYPINGFIANNMRVRFRVTNGFGGNGNTEFFFIDNLRIHDGGTVTAGHWEIRVDQSTGPGDDLNALGIRADDGDATSSGTELNIYQDSHTQYGIHPSETAGNTKTYTVYPYVVSGCSLGENDFDYDSNSPGNGPGGIVGSVSFASRTGVFSTTVSGTALAGDDVWNRDTVSGWTTDQLAGDYGIWLSHPQISTYNAGGENGNYSNVYYSNFQAAANPPTANPTANTFRVYLPTDAGAAPVKPYVDQILTFTTGQGGLSGPNPPAVGQTSKYTVTVRVVNPTARAITFSTPSNIVTANIPGGGAVYGGNAQSSQGTIVSQPSVGGTGNITWNPGTLAAGATALLSYVVNVTPTSAGQRIPVAATPASGNGTRAQWLDETGNATQSRATFLFGPLCELAVTQGLLTPAVVTDVRAVAEDGGVAVQWSTASEVGTVAFDVLRWDRAAKRWVPVNERALPAQIAAQQGGRYRLLDAAAPASGVASYMIVEHDNAGGSHPHGPFRVEIERGGTPREVDAPAAELFASAPKALRRAAPAWRETRAQPARGLGAAPQAALGSVQLAASVNARGVYRITAQDIVDIIGLPLGNVRKDIASHTFRLTNLGQEVDWFADPSFDSLLFYGEPSRSPFAADNVYLLKRRNGTLPPAEVDLAALAASDSVVRGSQHAEEQKLGATVVSTDPRSDFWYWDYVYAGDPVAGTRTFPVSAPGAVAGSSTAQLVVALRGATSTGVADEHHAIVRVNGSEVGELRFSGFDAATATLDVPSALLHADNSVSVEGVLDSGAAYSIFYVDSFDLSYDRTALADRGELLFRGAGGPATTVAGFDSPAITVWDVSDAQHPAPVRGAIDLRRVGSTLSLAASSASNYFAFTPSAIRQPALGAVADTTLLSPGHAADEVILAPAQWLQTVEQLASWRRAQGLRVEVVSLQDVWNGFNFGMPDPLAIKAFLAGARDTWSAAPRYVLLAGNGTFDYRDYAGLGGNLVPPALVSTASGLFASDTTLADFDDDGLPEMEVGRLPVSTETELSDAIGKIIAYESSPDAAWVGKALLLADADAQTDFTRDGRLVGSLLSGAYDVNPFELRTEPIQAARGRLLGALNSGAGLLNYVGHGGLDRLSSLGLLTSDDVPSLNNGVAAPIMTAFTCVVNRFELPGVRSLGAYLADRRSGGAVAVFAPTALSRSELGRDFGQAFYRAFVAGGTRLGDIIGQARGAVGSEEGAASFLPLYSLLGDPALVVRRPTPHGGGAPSPPGE